MRAVVFDQYGSPDVLHLAEVARPVPRDHEILVRVGETIVTPTDCYTRQGSPWIVRLFTGLVRPRIVPGVELAGTVEAVGRRVTAFRPGDEVFGASISGFGAHAEYRCLPEHGVVARLPVGITYGEAAAVCDGGLTALTFLRDVARIQPGQRLLVIGASGSVGSFAVQLGRHLGAEVTGVCGPTNLGLVRSLGAHAVIDYTREDYTAAGRPYDVVLDAVSRSSFARCRRVLSPRGLYLATVPTLGLLLQTLWTRLTRGPRAAFAATRHTRENLEYLRERLEAGELRAVIERSYPLARIAEAHRHVETGHKVGNVVVTVSL
jgi:NADPH:quinone reductase-like Zn-dependent oxidoreductase